MLGQLEDAGNTITLDHYLNLLEGAGLLTGLQKIWWSTGFVQKITGSPSVDRPLQKIRDKRAKRDPI